MYGTGKPSNFQDYSNTVVDENLSAVETELDPAKQAELLAVDIRRLLERLTGTWMERAVQHKLTLNVHIDPRLPEKLLTDPLRLEQILVNLLQNALDASEGLPVRQVQLSTVWNPQSRRVRLVVRDSGTGFPEAILKRAFEPYVTTKARGTGLGLAVVKKIADDHGARIDLKNIENDGQVVGAQVSLSFQAADT